MPQDKALTRKKLNQLWRDKSVKVLDAAGQKYAVFSDVHLGDGKGADDFNPNAKAMQSALEYYRGQGYTLILLGDIEEFWQFDLEQVAGCYGKTVYKSIRSFGDDRILRVFGNHDIEWSSLTDPARNKPIRSEAAFEALKMRDKKGRTRVLLVHGHQGSLESDKNSWISRVFVRLFKGVEPAAKWAGLYGHSSATKSQITKEYEKILYTWAKENKVLIICGHSHRAIFASKSYFERLADEIAALQAENLANRTDEELVKRNLRVIDNLNRAREDEKQKDREIEPVEPHGHPLPCYFNTGCALFTDGLTTIEVEDDEIRLVKWEKEMSGQAGRRVFDGCQGSLSEFVQAVMGG
jgi:UDP-2,3-diacylglucosamine pyrophosphatase LpxH